MEYLMDNLPELRDIHLPDGVSIFPPAYGWWVILAALISVILLYELISILRRKSKKRFALKTLNNIYFENPVQDAVLMSNLLRRVCVFKYKEAVTLSGQDWIDFLNSHCSQKIKDKPALLLINAPYIDKNTKKFTNKETKVLVDFCKTWIGENL